MTPFDIAIVGSDQASALLAGVLARDHNKKILLVQDLAAPFRLQRDYHLSFALATRPETFEFVNSQKAEAHRLLAKIAGRPVFLNVSPLCRAHSHAGTKALTHMMHMARYFGLEMERVEGGAALANSSYRIRGEQWVRPRLLWPALCKWVIDAGVQVVDATDGKIVTHRDGSARVDLGNRQIETAHLALTDGTALLKYGHKGDVRQNFVRQWGASLLTQPAQMRDGIVLQPEAGFCAWRQANGTLGMVARVSADQTGDLVRINLDAKEPLRRAGQAEFTHVVPTDGAPVIGRMSRSGVWVVNGFGQSTLYLIPAIARFLSARASAAEDAYFEPRGASADRPGVADFALLPVAGEMVT